MSDTRVYRIGGICSLAAIGVFCIEFPFYVVRGPFPSTAQSGRLIAFTTRNASNIMSCVLLDLIILTLLLVFLAGFRHLICRADPRQEWLATAFFGIGLVYVALTLVADSLQAATVVDAMSAPADGAAMRAMIESMYLMYGAVALFLMGAFIGLGSWLATASHALPAWFAPWGYACSLACFAFVPSMFAGHPDPNGFYNPAGWGPTSVAAGLPLAAWMVMAGIMMLRTRDAGVAIVAGLRQPSEKIAAMTK